MVTGDCPFEFLKEIVSWQHMQLLAPQSKCVNDCKGEWTNNISNTCCPQVSRTRAPSTVWGSSCLWRLICSTAHSIASTSCIASACTSLLQPLPAPHTRYRNSLYIASHGRIIGDVAENLGNQRRPRKF